MLKMFNQKNIIYLTSFLILVILIAIPFHAFLTVYFSSLAGHYTLLRLWKEFLLVPILLVGSYYAFFDQKIRKVIFKEKVTYLILAFLLVQVIWGVVSYYHHDVSKKALFYGLLLNCRYFIFFMLSFVIALKNKTLIAKIPKIVLYPALLVVLFGLLQIFVLPHNFLSHFGYGVKTIPAYETVNANSHYVRIISTLRGSNPLGAYLILPITLLGLLILKNLKKYKYYLFLLACLIVLIFSFSRSALLGAIIALIVVVFFSIKNKVVRRNLSILGLGFIIMLAILVFSFRNNPRVQNVLFHTQTHSASKISSDQAHLTALDSSFKQVLNNPLGSGPGTSGPASVYNNHPARIPENYYLQIAEETGIIGIVLYLAIIILVALKFWQNRDSELSLFLLASLIGISVVNLFLFGWADDTLSYLWWGIAGLTFAAPSFKEAFLPNSPNKSK